MEKQEKIEINNSLLAIKNRDNNAIVILRDLAGHSLWFIALKYLKKKEDAEDLFQDFWADIYDIADGFSYFKNGYSYICKVMTNRAINRYRQIHGEKEYVIEYVDFSNIPSSYNNEILDLESRLAVEQAFKRLTPTERIIMQLRLFEDKGIEQIAKELKMSKSDVGRKKLEAEEKLKRELSKNIWEKSNG
ncbi:MAG: sigma-70 family RNA polymerase sigma factor [Clostridia bacterium]|nr:sigma-70 family RNA polymerase sigma factor [Clostridia bacterium]